MADASRRMPVLCWLRVKKAPPLCRTGTEPYRLLLSGYLQVSVIVLISLMQPIIDIFT